MNLKMVRRLLIFFIGALVISGITAIPVPAELSVIVAILPAQNYFHSWLQKIAVSYLQVDSRYPYFLYGYDWLAFAHFVLAILFIGPYKDPVKNIWVIQFGLIASLLVFPLALIAGHFRGIPMGWQLIDCSFGLLGFGTLWVCYRKIKKLELKYKV